MNLDKLKELEAKATRAYPRYSTKEECNDPIVIVYEQDRPGVDMIHFRGRNRYNNAEHYATLRNLSPHLIALWSHAVERQADGDLDLQYGPDAELAKILAALENA